MRQLIGRKREQLELEEIYGSKKSEFVLVYGRRRVGKTFLIKRFFEKKTCLFFNVTGIKDGLLAEQLGEFINSIGKSFYQGATLATPNSWMKAFEELNKAIANQSKNKSIILFMDEFPWMATPKSRLIQTLEYYWNQHWSDNPKLKLIICGSSAAWIIKKILYQKGGLHNRVTRQIILKPFDLAETAQFLEENKMKLTRAQVIQIYMVFGGVPFYLEQLKRNKSIATNINDLCFKESSILFNELTKLFQSLFEPSEDYLTLIKLIARCRSGISRTEIEKKSKKIFHGGRLTERLNDLETAGFIKSFLPLMHEKYGIYYRILDEFCYFSLKWIEPEKSTLLTLIHDHHYWLQKMKSSSYQAWSGYSFEMLCYKHISKIGAALHIAEDARVGAWRYLPRKHSEETGTQIDLMFDQIDSITLCEIKYSEKFFTLDKSNYLQLLQKMNVLKKITKTHKQIFLALISANDVIPNYYSEELNGIVTTSDLF